VHQSAPINRSLPAERDMMTQVIGWRGVAEQPLMRVFVRKAPDDAGALSRSFRPKVLYSISSELPGEG
jgi:hypothetical protein